MSTTRTKSFLLTTLILGVLALPTAAIAAGFVTVADSEWDEAAVRRVLHVFAYGGAASDQQINAWSTMAPNDAIEEMLTFQPSNPLLSPVEDNTANHAASLEDLQALWSTAGPDNLKCSDDMAAFNETNTQPDGDVVLRNQGLQYTWIAAVRTRGLNPFRHRVGFWLINYQMAVNLHDTEPPLIRDLYDRALDSLASNAPFHEVLGIGATSAAVAREYGHRSNTYNNNTSVFRGNDDFAREFHQLFFRINGVTEDPDYHENTTIENTAWTLTGMQIDKIPGAYGTNLASEWWVAPIDFTDHVDASGRTIRNSTRHNQSGLEILRQPIIGATAAEKLTALAEIAIQHPESLDNMPVAIINFFADDNLDVAKVEIIRDAWQQLVGQEDDLLHFLQTYAISETFHKSNTFKYTTAFDRNMVVYNLNTVDNEETYGNSFTPRAIMQLQGAEVFIPVHDVFGGQTSLNAANNPNLFKEAYNNSVNFPNRFGKFSEACRDADGNTMYIWRKDWGRLIPLSTGGNNQVDDVAEWLWQRFVGDGGRNYGPLERAHITALLATGFDLGYLADPNNPDASYSAQDLQSEPLASIIAANLATTMDLDSTVTAVQRDANNNIGLAVNFISMTPFMFVNGDLNAQEVIRDNILWRNNGDGKNALWLMNGDTRVGNLAVPTVSDTTWNIVGRGDYDGDGEADILWRKIDPGQPGHGRIAIWLMLDNTINANLGLPTVSNADWTVAGNGDYNGDGHTDILWRNRSNGQNALWLINNGVQTANLGVAPVGLDWDVISSGDFDGDNNADILWRNSSNGQNALWRMSGATRLANLAIPTVADLNWQMQGNGDYNGDGKSDMLWRHDATGSNAMWLMNGSTITANLAVSRVADTNWQVVGDGDYDGDGNADILWRNLSSGANAMWLMIGNTMVTNAGVDRVADLNWEVVYRR